MPISSVDFVVASPGSGGANLVGDVYTDPGDGIQKYLPYSGIVVGTQNGTYEVVGPSASLPVAIVGTVEIVDGGSSITVDGAVGATQVGDWYSRLLDGVGNAIESGIATPSDTARGLVVRNIENANQGDPAALANAWPVKISDGTDFATVTTVGGNVGLDVNVIGGIGGSSITDKAIFTPGSDTLTMAGGTYRSARDNVGDGRGGAFAMTTNRALYVSLETATGDPIADDTLNALRMMVVNSSGTQIDSFGGGVEYTEGAADSSITGKAIMWEDTSDTLRVVSASKPLPVEIIASSAGGTAMVDDAAFTFATTSFTPAGGVYNSSRDSVDSGDGGAFAMTPKRGQYVVLETPNGDSMAIESINALQVAIVDGAGAQITTFGGGFQYAEDSAHVSGDSGNMALAVRRDANTSLVGTDGDYAPLQVDATGSLKVSIISGAGSGGTAMTDDAVFTPDVSNVTPAGATYRATRDAVDDGDIGAVAMTAKRGLLTSIETVNGDPVTNDTLNSVVMSCAFPTVVTGLCSGTGASSSLDISELGTVGVTLSGTASSITAVFQVSNDGGTTWLNIIGKRTTTGLFEAGPVGMALAGTAASWQVSVAGYNRFRINFTAVSYTSLSYSIQGIAETFPGEGFSGTILDDAAFTFGANYIMAVGGVYNSTRDSLDSGDAGAIALNIKRGVFTTLEDSNGNAIVASTANPVAGDLSLAVKLTPPSSNSVAYPMKITDGTTVVSVRDLATSDALNVAIVDATGAQITSLVHTEFAEDSAHASGDKGNMPLAVRNDTNSSLVSANGDYAPFQVDATGLLKVNVVTSSASSGGASIVDDAPFAVGTSSLTPVGGTYISTRDPIDNGDSGAFAMTQKRSLYVTPENSAATELTVVDNAAFTDGTTPVTPAGFIFDETAGASLTENDAAAARVDSKRAQVLVLEDATTRGQRAAISSAGALSVSDTQVLADNAAFTDGTTKVFASGYIFDDVAGTALTENDIAAARIDSKRAQVLVLEDGTTRGQRAAISSAGAVSENMAQIAGNTISSGVGTSGSGVQRVIEANCSTGTVTSVGGSASSVSLLASNANRRGASVFNDSTAYLYLKLGSTASTSSFTVRIDPYGYYEIPQPVYTGAIDGIWASATGSARITELT